LVTFALFITIKSLLFLARHYRGIHIYRRHFLAIMQLQEFKHCLIDTPKTQKKPMKPIGQRYKLATLTSMLLTEYFLFRIMEQQQITKNG